MTAQATLPWGISNASTAPKPSLTIVAVDDAKDRWRAGRGSDATRQRLLGDARRRLADLLRLADGWDGHRASPPSELSASVLNAILNEVVRDDQPTPQVTPTPEGGTQVTWLVNGNSVEIDVAPHGEVVVLAFDRPTGQYVIDEEFIFYEVETSLITRIAGVLQRLSADVRTRLAPV